jgi:transcriptional regulator GlxA family with amidase domain
MPRRASTREAVDPSSMRGLVSALQQRPLDEWSSEFGNYFRSLPSTRFDKPAVWIMLFHELARALVHQTVDGSATAPSLPGDDCERIEAIARAIRERYAERLTLAGLARSVGGEPRILASLFRAQMGQTIHECLTHVRMSHAIAFIARGEKVEYVGIAVGYRSKKNFYRQFRAVTGVTPASFRRLTQRQGTSLNT